MRIIAKTKYRRKIKLNKMIYTPNNNNFVQSSTAEYGGFYGSTYTSLTQEYAKIFNTSKTDDTVKKWTTTPHNYTEKNYKCL